MHAQNGLKYLSFNVSPLQDDFHGWHLSEKMFGYIFYYLCSFYFKLFKRYRNFAHKTCGHSFMKLFFVFYKIHSQLDDKRQGCFQLCR